MSTDSPSTLEARLRANEAIWRRFRQIELDMLNAETLADVVRPMVQHLQRHFSGVQAVSIVWIDPQYEFERELLCTSPATVIREAWVSLPDRIQDVPPSAPVLGPLHTEQQRLLFPQCRETLHSVAMVPMMLRGQLVGSLNQGSRDPLHFHPEVATDLIEHLAAVTAVCLDSTVNRAHLQRDVLTDALTGVSNRRFFERRLQEEGDAWRRHGHPLTCLMVDLDHFKRINDQLGHAAGDQAIRQVAQQLAQGLRSSDVLARYGGEEFALLLPATDSMQAQDIAERLRNSIERMLFMPEGLEASRCLTISIGLATLDETVHSRVTGSIGSWLVREADGALYQAKAHGRNRIELASPPENT